MAGLSESKNVMEVNPLLDCFPCETSKEEFDHVTYSYSTIIPHLKALDNVLVDTQYIAHP